MSANKLILVTDPRINRITNEVTQVVKSGVKTTLQEKFPTISANANTVVWNANIPSNDTLIDRNNIKVRANIDFWFKKSMTVLAAGGTGVSIIEGAPCAFPLNSICNTVTSKINGVSMSVPSDNVANILLKQYDQKTISEFNGTTPSFVDTFWGKFADSAADDFGPMPSSPLSDTSYGNDDVVQRGAYPVRYRVFYKDAVSTNWEETYPAVGQNTNFITTEDSVDGVYLVQCVIEVNEPILGLAPMEAFSSSESSLFGVRTFELKLGLNDCKNIWNEYGQYVITEVGGGIHVDAASAGGSGLLATNHPIKKEAELRLTQLTIHDSSYGKINAQSKLPIMTYEAQVSPILIVPIDDATKIVSSQTLSLGFIPDKFYIQVRVPYANQHSGLSNILGYSIKNLKIRFNNKAGILNEQDTHELYLTSKKNGNNQSWPEFSGKLTTRYSTDVRSIGSIMVVDPTMDLDIADMLSSGSSGTYQFQVTVEFNNALHTNSEGVVEPSPYELVVMYSYSNILTTKQGKSALEFSYLTMEDVIKTKAGDSAMDYTELTEQMDGGRRKPIPLNAVGDYLSRSGKVIKAANDAAKGGGYSQSGGGYTSSGGGYTRSGGGYTSSGGAASGIDRYL